MKGTSSINKQKIAVWTFYFSLRHCDPLEIILGVKYFFSAYITQKFALTETLMISIKPVLNDHLSYVTIFDCSLERSHKTGLIVYLINIDLFLRIFLSIYNIDIIYRYLNKTDTIELLQVLCWLKSCLLFKENTLPISVTTSLKYCWKWH